MTTRAFATIGLALALAGCIDAQPNLFVYGLCGLPDDAIACKAPGGKCDTYSNGQYLVYTTVTINDVTNPGATITVLGDFSWVAEVHNAAPNNASEDVGRVNGRDAVIESAKLSYGGALGVPDIEVPATFTPVPAGGTATIYLPVVPSSALAAFHAALPVAPSEVSMLVEVRLRGRYADGSDFETGPFQVPMTVRKGPYNAAAITCADPTQQVFFCPAPGQSGKSKCG